MCGPTCLAASDGHELAAVATWRSTTALIASRVSGRSRGPGNSGSAGLPVVSLSQRASTSAAAAVSGVDRCFRPLPVQVMAAPAPRVTSAPSEPAQLRDPQPGVNGQQEQGVVSPPESSGAVGRSKQRVDLGSGEVGDRASVSPFGGDGEHSLDEPGVLGMAEGGEGEE